MASFYELMCIFIPWSLTMWVIDFLSDSQITKDETKIGCLQYIHHLASVLAFMYPFINLVIPSFTFFLVSIPLSIIVQIGFLRNNDYCWLTRLANKCIDPNHPNRKWRSTIDSFIKHYIRGDSWAYSDMGPQNFESGITMINIALLIGLVVIILKQSGIIIKQPCS